LVPAARGGLPEAEGVGAMRLLRGRTGIITIDGRPRYLSKLDAGALEVGPLAKQETPK
jgi:hypothetical protein